MARHAEILGHLGDAAPVGAVSAGDPEPLHIAYDSRRDTSSSPVGAEPRVRVGGRERGSTGDPGIGRPVRSLPASRR